MSDIKVLFFSYDYSYPRNRVLIEGLRKNCVDVIEWDIPYITHTIPRYAQLLRNYTTNYDVLFMGFPGGRDNMPIAKLLSVFNRRPIVFDAFISQYDTKVFDRKVCDEKSMRAKQYFYSDKIPCGMADIILLDTNEHIDYFVDTFNIPKEKFRRVFVGSDDGTFYPRENVKNDDDFIVTFHGNFIPLQGIQYIIRAAKLLERYDDIKFEILGYGSTYGAIRNLSKKLITCNVAFKERVKYEELPNFINSGDVCLGIFGDTAKAKRVIPNKVYEILAMRKPLITGISPAVMEGGINNRVNALLVEMANPEAIADAILELKDDEKLKNNIAKNGYMLFKENFTPNIIGKAVKNALEEIVSDEISDMIPLGDEYEK